MHLGKMMVLEEERRRIQIVTRILDESLDSITILLPVQQIKYQLQIVRFLGHVQRDHGSFGDSGTEIDHQTQSRIKLHGMSMIILFSWHNLHSFIVFWPIKQCSKLCKDNILSSRWRQRLYFFQIRNNQGGKQASKQAVKAERPIVAVADNHNNIIAKQ